MSNEVRFTPLPDEIAFQLRRPDELVLVVPISATYDGDHTLTVYYNDQTAKTFHVPGYVPGIGNVTLLETDT